MTATLGLAVLWIAAAHRLVLAVRGPQLWRLSLAATLLCLAGSGTVYFTGVPLVQAPNIGKLAAELLSIAAAVSVRVYLHTLGHDHTPLRRILGRMWHAVPTCVVLIATWILAPVHEREVRHLVDLAHDPLVTAHLVFFYLYTASYSVPIARFCARQVIARGHQPSAARGAQRLSLLVIGLANALSGISLLFLAGATALSPTSVDSAAGAEAWEAHGESLVGWSFFVLGLGVLSLSHVVPWTAQVTALLHRRMALRPLWAELTARHPDVVLPIPPSPRLLQTLQLREQRMLVEIHDALAREGVPESVRTPRDLADALRRKSSGPTSAAAVVRSDHGRSGDLENLMTLGARFAETKEKRRPVRR